MLLFCHSAMSNFLRPHGLKHAKLPCPHCLPELAQTPVWRVSDASNHVILCHPLLLLPQSFPVLGSFSMSELFTSDSQSIGTLASAPVLPMNIQGWFPLGLTGLILLSKALSRVFSSTTIQSHRLQCSAFFTVQPSHTSMTIGKTVSLTMWTFVGKVMSLLFITLSTFAISLLGCSHHPQWFWNPRK